MNRRKSLTDIGIAALKARPKRYAFPDPQLGGHFIRVTPTGSKSFCAVARDPVSGKQVWATLAATDLIGIVEARERARDAIKRVKAGQPAFEPVPIKPDSLKAVSELYINRQVIGQGLRSRYEIERMFKAYIWPALGDREFSSIRRSDIVRMLDEVEDKNGARQAEMVLAAVRALCNWYAIRADDYVPPTIRGMRRIDAKARARTRILNDDELRAVWARAEEQGSFGAYVKLLLLTAQRRSALASMRWADLKDGAWHMPREDRQKGVGGVLVLPHKALAIIETLPRVASNSFVFAGRGAGHFKGYGPCKRAFDAGLPPMPGYVLHDLRRTSRSLMSRAAVSSDHAEKVMGHVIAGVEGIYDRHSYREKAEALARLAALIETIITPPSANVIPLKGAAR